MIGRSYIEGSKSTVGMNAWLPQASYSLVFTNMKIGSHFILKIFDILKCIQLFHYNCIVTFLKHTHHHISYAQDDRNCKGG